jgi:hypothetical protein
MPADRREDGKAVEDDFEARTEALEDGPEEDERLLLREERR